MFTLVQKIRANKLVDTCTILRFKEGSLTNDKKIVSSKKPRITPKTTHNVNYAPLTISVQPVINQSVTRKNVSIHNVDYAPRNFVCGPRNLLKVEGLRNIIIDFLRKSKLWGEKGGVRCLRVLFKNFRFFFHTEPSTCFTFTKGALMLIETYALMAKNDPDELASPEDYPVDPVVDLLDDVNGPAGREGGVELYDTEFLFEMSDVSAINRSAEVGYTTIFMYGERWTVKIAWEDAKKLFITCRGEAKDA